MPRKNAHRKGRIIGLANVAGRSRPHRVRFTGAGLKKKVRPVTTGRRRNPKRKGR